MLNTHIKLDKNTVTGHAQAHLEDFLKQAELGTIVMQKDFTDTIKIIKAEKVRLNEYLNELNSSLTITMQRLAGLEYIENIFTSLEDK